jgi:SAM-dependent methyltransferase
MTRCGHATPKEIVEHIIAFAALPAHGRIFELGCGTGQMTLPFAQRGYIMVAIDQGERLAALTAQHCRPYPQVRVVPCAFEAWQDVAGSYDLFLAAQAIHWIEPHYGMRRATELLKPGGTIALVGTADRSQGSAFWQATEPIYNTYNPVDSAANLQPRWPGETYRQALRASGQFRDLQEVRTSWSRRYSGEEYLKLLWTFSDHRAMPEPRRSRFFEDRGVSVLTRFVPSVPSPAPPSCPQRDGSGAVGRAVLSGGCARVGRPRSASTSMARSIGIRTIPAARSTQP